MGGELRLGDSLGLAPVLIFVPYSAFFSEFKVTDMKNIMIVAVAAVLLCVVCPGVAASEKTSGSSDLVTGLGFDIQVADLTGIGVSAPLDTDLIEYYIIQRVNSARTSRGLSALSESSYLDGTAKTHSDHMASLNNLHHDLPLAWSGGENVANMLPGRVYIPCPRRIHNVPNTEDGIARFTMHAFMSHDRCQGNGHKKNILRASFHTIGVGVSYGYGRYWITQDFAY